ncbi:MAG TPA: hypothetical protein GXZ96_00785 [Firmicutes bacterium]|nr:hypothetical protein [Bacillota bacterium]
MRAVFTGIVLALILVHYIELIAGAAVLGWTQSLLAMAMFLVGILLTRQNQRYYALAIMSTGAIIFFLRPFTGTPLFDGFRQLNMMVGTLMLVPVLGVLFDLRGYVYALLGLATRYLKRPPFFLSALAVLSNLVSAMLLVGCLPLIYHLVEKVAEGDESGLRQRLLTVSILQGCSSAGLWSPSWVLVAMSLSIGTRWQEIALYGFLLAAVSILVASAYLFFLARPLWHAPLLANGQEEETGVPPNRALEFLFLLVVFLAVVLLGDTYTDLGVINVVPLAAVALTALGYTLTGNITELPGRAWKFLQGQIPRQSGILSLLMSTGFLSAALFSTGLGLDLFNAFLGLLDQFSISILTGLPILICLLGYVGIDPVLAVVLILPGLTAGMLADLPTYIISLALMAGGSASLSCAPFAASTMIMAGQVQSDPIRVGTCWNWPYSLAFLTLAILILNCLARFA